MIWPQIIGGCVLVVLVGAWLFFAWRRRKPKAPAPTPWADSTKVAQQVREQREGR